MYPKNTPLLINVIYVAFEVPDDLAQVFSEGNVCEKHSLHLQPHLPFPLLLPVPKHVLLPTINQNSGQPSNPDQTQKASNFTIAKGSILHICWSFKIFKSAEIQYQHNMQISSYASVWPATSIAKVCLPWDPPWSVLQKPVSQVKTPQLEWVEALRPLHALVLPKRVGHQRMVQLLLDTGSRDLIKWKSTRNNNAYTCRTESN